MVCNSIYHRNTLLLFGKNQLRFNSLYDEMFFIEISSLKMRPIKTLRLINSDKGLIEKTDFNSFPLSCQVRFTTYTLCENIKC